MTLLRWVNYALCPPSSQYEVLLQVQGPVVPINGP